MKVKKTYLVMIKLGHDDILMPEPTPPTESVIGKVMILGYSQSLLPLYQTDNNGWYLNGSEITAQQAAGLILRTKNIMLKGKI